MNGWYLYQTLSSRILARAGFYQVGGAYGFRDQLQDTTNIAIIAPELTKAQIYNNASHQFMEGDVLHWWHEDNKLGLRSSFFWTAIRRMLASFFCLRQENYHDTRS